MKLSIKRIIAYIIDMAVVFILVLMISMFIKPNVYEQNLKETNEQYALNNIDFKEYKSEYITLTYNIDKTNFGINFVTMIFIIIIFIIIPYSKKQTIGQFFMKIRFSDKKIKNLFLRSIIINGLGYMIIMLLILFLVSEEVYFILINFLAFCQISLVIINGFMILYKKEHIGLTDILTNSRIEEIK